MRTAVGEKPPPNVSWSSRLKYVVALDKDRVVVETAMRLDVAVAVLVVEGLAGLPARPEPWSDSLTASPGQRLTVPDSLTALTALSLTA